MSKIFITNHFFTQAKRLKKKFLHLKTDLIKALKSFKPEKEIHLGKSIFKIRIKSQDINKGKSGGIRCYIYLYRKKGLIVPLCIYFKSEKESLSKNELEYHSAKMIEELAEHFG